MIRIAVFVSGGGTNLQALIDAKKDGLIPNGELCLVLASKPDIYALNRADAANIPGIILRKLKDMSIDEYGDRIIEALNHYKIDIVVLAGFLTILPENVIKAYQNKIINVHPSLIPAFSGPGYYGLKVHEEALKRGVKITGATVHYVNEIADGGEIIAQKAVEVFPGDTPEILQKRVMAQAEWLLLPKAVSDLCDLLIKGEA